MEALEMLNWIYGSIGAVIAASVLIYVIHRCSNCHIQYHKSRVEYERNPTREEE